MYNYVSVSTTVQINGTKIFNGFEIIPKLS